MELNLVEINIETEILVNKKTNVQHVHYSRYIASWRNVGGEDFDEFFEEFLKNNGCTDQEVHDIVEMANGGMFELEKDARTFVQKQKDFFKKFEDEE